MHATKPRFTKLDAVLCLAVVAGGVYMAYRVSVGLSYKWNWAVIPEYLFRHDPEKGWVPNLLVLGLLTTIRLSIWSTLLGGIIGLVMGLFRVSPSLFKRMVGRTYVELIRNLPPLVMIFIFYFFVAEQIMPHLGLDQWARSLSPAGQTRLTWLLAPPGLVSAFVSAAAAMAVYEGAYITEIVRSGIQSVESGQWQAAKALGMNRWQQLRHVVLPQAIERVIPPLAGQFVSAIKDSSIVSVISIQELTFQGMELMAATYLTIEVWLTITAMYLILTLGCSLALGRLENRARRGRV